MLWIWHNKAALFQKVNIIDTDHSFDHWKFTK